jgi:hypothetical protein
MWFRKCICEQISSVKNVSTGKWICGQTSVGQISSWQMTSEQFYVRANVLQDNTLQANVAISFSNNILKVDGLFYHLYTGCGAQLIEFELNLCFFNRKSQ